MSDDNKILQFRGLTKVDIKPEDVLVGTIDAKLDEVLVIGMKDDSLFISSSSADIPENNFLLDLAKRWMLEYAENEMKP